MAGALRNDDDLAPAELSQIEEEDGLRMLIPHQPSSQREREYKESAIMVRYIIRLAEQGLMIAKRQRSVSKSHVGGTIYATIKASAQSESDIGYVSSFVLKKQPVMPDLLGKSASEYHPSGPRQPGPYQQSRSVHGGHGVGPRGENPPNPMYVPPNLAPTAVSGGIEDVQGPRHSALGLEGIEAQSGGANAFGQGMAREESLYTGNTARENHGGLGGLLDKMKAPTVRRKRTSWYA